MTNWIWRLTRLVQVEREGTSVTLVAHSRPVGDCLEAAKLLEADGISAEVINLRSIRPLDIDTIIARFGTRGRAHALVRSQQSA